MNISVVVIVKDGSVHLPKFLQQLENIFENIIVLIDDRTTDQSAQIAQTYSNTEIHYFTFEGFGKAKKLACSFAKYDWILSLDVDEFLDTQALHFIANHKFEQPNAVYKICRKNYYKDQHISGAGWKDDKPIRIFNKTHTNFAPVLVHEYIVEHTDTVVKSVEGHIKHYPYDSIFQLIQKMNFYSDLYIKQNLNKKSSSVFKSIYKGLFAFFRDYILDKGFMFGYKGLVISFTNASGTFYKYIKLYEAQKLQNKDGNESHK
ncbi:MAG: glycosyltransferase family 2 protein [Cytophagales bacterium]